MSDNRVYKNVRELQPSEDAYQLIREAEGLRLTSYICPAGKPTIGYGRVIPNLNSPRTCTKHQADQWLVEDAQSAVREIQRQVTVPLTQGQFDALVSFIFNFGGTKFSTSTLRRKLNARDYEGAEAEFDKWVGRPNNNGNPLPGLVIRRNKEEALFDKK